MKIALFDCFPNLSHSAEKEFISRSIIVLERLGHRAQGVRTSDEINAFDPEFVIVTHEFVAKTTDHFTVGLLWSPLEHYAKESDRIKAIRSWDMIVPINEEIREFAQNLHPKWDPDEAVSRSVFFPSAQLFEIDSPEPARIALAYVGAHWDGERHRQLIEALVSMTDLNVYGPAEKWQFISQSYRGEIPFDGVSLLRTLSRHGAVLAIHKKTHRLADTPSMRVFEACAANCLVFTEPMPSIKALFGDSLEYIDPDAKPSRVARFIARRVKYYNKDHKALKAKIATAQKRFRSHASLEFLYDRLIIEVAEKSCRRSARLQIVDGGIVSIIIRCGSRPLQYLERAVTSLKRQTYQNVGIIFSKFGEIPGFEAFVIHLQQTERFAFVSVVCTQPNGLRSTPLWAAFRTIKTDFFAVLDDDDELYSAHVADLVNVLEANVKNDVAYSGVIKCQEDGANCNQHPRFDGPGKSGVVERRTLHFFDEFDFNRLLQWDNFIQSNTWLARSSLLVGDLLEDPELFVMEDVYFYLMAARRGPFVFSGHATAVWNWRLSCAPNSMTTVSEPEWAMNGNRVVRLLAEKSFPNGYRGHEIVGVGIPTRGLTKTELKEQSMWHWLNRLKQRIRKISK